MAKSTESKLALLTTLRETPKAIQVNLLAITSTGGETSIVEWLPRSITRLEGNDVYVPAWKAQQIERSLPYGWCCSLPV